jgi:NADH:ubiquinone oxidoreductase subunit 6 (subunit J)
MVAPALPPAAATAGGGIVELGRSLFGRLIAPFELTAPLLLVAIVGAVSIWRRQERMS